MIIFTKHLFFDVCTFSVLKYPVLVHTAKKSGAGTDANVFLNIFGNQGDTGERPLMFSKNNRNKFEKGNVSYCHSLLPIKHIVLFFKSWPVWVADNKQQMYQRIDSLTRQ